MNQATHQAPSEHNTIVHLMRHGEVFNPDKVLYGRLNGYKLSELGHEMAQTVADAMSATRINLNLPGEHRDIRAVIASPLLRAQQTATPMAKAFDLPLHTDDRILEAENHFQGLTFGQGRGKLSNPEHWWHLRNPMQPSWGEPYTQQVTRMIAAVHDARRLVAGHEAVLVSHQLPIYVTRLSAEGRKLWHDPRNRECTLASVTSLVFNSAGYLLDVVYSEPAGHLLAKASKVAGA